MRKIVLGEAFWLADVLASEAGASPEALRERVTRRLASMDERGIDVKVLSCPAESFDVRRDTAADDAKRVNDLIADVISMRPDRFAGLAVLPLHDAEVAVRELIRSVKDLGLNGVFIDGQNLEHYLDEPQFEPFWTELARLDVPVYLYEAPQMSSAELPQMPDKMHRWATETDRHGLRILLSGVFERHPGAKIIESDLTGILPLQLLPFQLRDLDEMYSKDPSYPLPEPPSYYVRRNFFITTSGVSSSAALIGAVRGTGAGQILLATEPPYGSVAEAVAFLGDPSLHPGDAENIAHGNAERVLKIAPRG